MNTLPTSHDMTGFIKEFIAETYSPWSTANDESFTENNFEVYPKSEGGFTVVVYKTRTPVCKDLADMFEYSQSPEDNKALKSFCTKLEKWLDKLDLYKFKAIPGRRLTKQVVSVVIYPDCPKEKLDTDLEKFDIKDLTKDSRIKQNESKEKKVKYDTIAEFLKLDESLDESDYNEYPDDSGYEEFNDAEEDFWNSDVELDEYDDMHAFGYTGGHYNDRNDADNFGHYDYDDEDSDEYDDDYSADEYDDFDKGRIFEAVLKEGDCAGGCTCASDFAGQVPENMGAVVGPGKNDKKFSDVFGD